MYVPSQEFIDAHREMLEAFAGYAAAFETVVNHVRLGEVADCEWIDLHNGETEDRYRYGVIRELELVFTYVTVINGLLHQGMLGEVTAEVRLQVEAEDEFCARGE
ncbi:hypothetical protein [Kamptonema sp. UHCC 0994]|uniref:hypothetical protein n=1 Tax=Kamptonema sp. UHCC 0994 TaxID=3031329 RepID=UPI0023B93759|nr:hypothetical protein [Kamptonema sp. UHCC 0994]MDF0553402.1 hypothetical protein [Kamptonema sp. UHCC 0994]